MKKMLEQLKKKIVVSSSRTMLIISGIPIIGRGFAENGIKQTTEEALSRIAQAVE